MFRYIEGLSQDVMAIEATGKITREDYNNELIPRAEGMMTRGPIKMLYVIGKDFTGFELEALWDDSAFGLRHWHDFSHIAVVTDHAARQDRVRSRSALLRVIGTGRRSD